MTDFEEFRKEAIKESARYYEIPEEILLASCPGPLAMNSMRVIEYWKIIKGKRKNIRAARED